MTDNETADDDQFDAVAGLAHMISFSVEAMVRGGKITPDEAIRAMASALWGTVIVYSAPEHLESNSKFAVETFEVCRDAATEAMKEVKFDEQFEGTQWGTA